MANRLTLLTPMAYFHVRLRSMFYRRRVGFMVFGLALVISACILLWPSGQRTQAAGSPHILSADHLVTSNEPAPTFTFVESVPLPTSTDLPPSTPTPLPIPDSGVVWASSTNGVYLQESPESKILAHLPNGTKVRFLEGRAWYGNLPWIQVASPFGEGWILQSQVFRAGEDPVAYVAIREGTYLRDQPGGGVQQILSMGTPIMRILETQDMEGRTWAFIEVVDGSLGWVVRTWLSAEMPLDDHND